MFSPECTTLGLVLFKPLDGYFELKFTMENPNKGSFVSYFYPSVHLFKMAGSVFSDRWIANLFPPPALKPSCYNTWRAVAVVAVTHVHQQIQLQNTLLLYQRRIRR